MPNDFNIQSIGAVHAASDSAGDTTVAAITPPEPPPAPTPSTPWQLPNPRLRLDPTLGLVVLEFHNDTNGAVTRTIPSQSQLEAYQRWDVTKFGPPPAGRHERYEPPPTRPTDERKAHSPPAKANKVG
jgi:hypothetical protein